MDVMGVSAKLAHTEGGSQQTPIHPGANPEEYVNALSQERLHQLPV